VLTDLALAVVTVSGRDLAFAIVTA